MDKFFDRMKAKFGRKFTADFDDPDYYDVWLETWAAVMLSLSAEQIKLGMSRLGTLEWPPSEGEFRNLCTGEHRLNYEQMFKEAANLAAQSLGGLEVKWTSAILYWSAKTFGFAELRTAMYEGNKRRWADIVDAVREEDVLAPIPTEERQELPAPGKKTVTDEEARQRIAQAVSGMRMGGPAKTTDEEFGLNSFNDWIKKAHQAHTKRQTMDAAEAAMKRMGWGEDKIARFKAKCWV